MERGSAPGSSSAMSPLRMALDAVSRLHRDRQIDVGAAGPDWLPASGAFADPALLNRLLAAQAAFTTDLDRKAQAAYLVIDHSMMLSLCIFAPWLGAGVIPDIAPEKVALRFHSRTVAYANRSVDELMTSMRLLAPSFITDRAEWADHADARTLADRPAVLDQARRSLEDYFEPLIGSLHAMTGLSQRAMWRLAGDSVAAVCLDAGRRLDCEEQAKADALAVLKKAGSPLANKQMHYFDIVIARPGRPADIVLRRTFRSRGGCCRYYTSREGSLCTTCVLLDPATRDRNLQHNLRMRLGLPEASPPPL